MIKVTNKMKSPVQLVVRSKTATNSFTTLIVPGVGSGKNSVLLEDEQTTEYITRLEKQDKVIEVKSINNANEKRKISSKEKQGE